MRRACLALALLLPLASPGPAAAQNAPPRPAREAVVANETDRILQELYLHPAGGEDGPDRLGHAVLPPRASLRIPLERPRQCAWALRAVFDDGQEERRRLDLCRNPRLVLTDRGPRREVDLVNDHDLDLRELYLWPSGSAGPGPDRLGSNSLGSGETQRIRLRGTSACRFDLRAVYADDSEELREGLDLCRQPRLGFGDPSLPVRAAPVLNRGRRALRELYARPAGTGDWGPDRLGSTMLEPRGSFPLRVRARACRFDLRGVDEDDGEEVQNGIDLCQVQGVVFDGSATGIEDRALTLSNRTGHTVQQVFLVRTGAADWGDDRLGTGVLGDGLERTIFAATGCQADLRIVFDSMAAEERRGIDICANPGITLRPGWTLTGQLAGDPAAAPPPEAPTAPEAPPASPLPEAPPAAATPAPPG